MTERTADRFAGRPADGLAGLPPDRPATLARRRPRPPRRVGVSAVARSGAAARWAAIFVASALASAALWIVVLLVAPEDPPPRGTEGRLRWIEVHEHRLPAADEPGQPAATAMWRLLRDPNHFVRGRALEALANAGAGARLEPGKAAELVAIAREDTDFDRRGACRLLLQADVGLGLPQAARLFTETRNPATRDVLIRELSHAGAGRRDVLERAAAGRGAEAELARQALAIDAPQETSHPAR